MNIFVNYYIWTVTLFAQYILVTYLSLKASREQTNMSLFFVWVFSLIPNWIMICKYSNDLVLAGFIYDFIVTLGWTIGVIIFEGKSFTWSQYAGILFMVAGLLLFKKGS